MVSRSDATLNLASLLKHAVGSPDSLRAEGLLMPEPEVLEADGLVLHGPLSWQLEVSSTGGEDEFLLDGTVRGTAVLECRRCLSEALVDADAGFMMTMVYDPSETTLRLDEGGDDDEERLVFGLPTVDFGPLLAQLFAIELPITALCREDCKGLSLEGVNLNEHPELAPEHRSLEHDERPAPSPFEALKDVDFSQ